MSKLHAYPGIRAMESALSAGGCVWRLREELECLTALTTCGGTSLADHLDLEDRRSQGNRGRFWSSSSMRFSQESRTKFFLASKSPPHECVLHAGQTIRPGQQGPQVGRVAHLYTGVEMLFKYRLICEGWRLVLDDNDDRSVEVTEEDNEAGRFRSIGIGKALTRLKDLDGITFTSGATHQGRALH